MASFSSIKYSNIDASKFQLLKSSFKTSKNGNTINLVYTDNKNVDTDKKPTKQFFQLPPSTCGKFGQYEGVGKFSTIWSMNGLLPSATNKNLIADSEKCLKVASEIKSRIATLLFENQEKMCPKFIAKKKKTKGKDKDDVEESTTWTIEEIEDHIQDLTYESKADIECMKTKIDYGWKCLNPDERDWKKRINQKDETKFNTIGSFPFMQGPDGNDLKISPSNISDTIKPGSIGIPLVSLPYIYIKVAKERDPMKITICQNLDMVHIKELSTGASSGSNDLFINTDEYADDATEKTTPVSPITEDEYADDVESEKEDVKSIVSNESGSDSDSD